MYYYNHFKLKKNQCFQLKSHLVRHENHCISIRVYINTDRRYCGKKNITNARHVVVDDCYNEFNTSPRTPSFVVLYHF